MFEKLSHTPPQPLYNTIIGIQNENRVSKTTNNYVVSKQKCIDHIEKWPFMVIFLHNLYIFV